MNIIIVKIEGNIKYFNYLVDIIILKFFVVLMSNWGIVFFLVISKINIKSKSKVDLFLNDKFYK